VKLPSLLIPVVVAALTGCHEHTEAPPIALQPAGVRVQPVRTGDISEVLSITGETAALSTLRLASPIAGRVTWLTARPGDRLDAGTVAARMISLENEAAIHGFAFLDRAAHLSAAERARDQRVQRELETRDIPLRVPFTAVVAERLHNPGEQVAANDVLLELFDPQSLYVLAQVPVESASRIRGGMGAEINTGNATVSGQVEALAAALVPQTLTVPVRIRLATPLTPPLLHAAVTARVTVAQHHDALLIPRSALLSSNVTDQAVVMVAADHTAHRRPIHLGLRTASDVEVTQGLAEGELVLTDGQYALPDNAPIAPRPASD
jgi:multidrug efflux pump subunit AcrA (membrane-fusion protein)